MTAQYSDDATITATVSPASLAGQQATGAVAFTIDGISIGNVIGHNESLTSPYHRELYRPWRCQTHADWRRADMDVYRAKLSALLRRDRIPLGPPAAHVAPRC